MIQKKVVTLQGVSVLTVNFRVLVVVRNTKYNYLIFIV